MWINSSRLWRRAGRVWVQGLLLFCLRFAQNRTGFDPSTGLSTPNAPGIVLAACLIFCAAAEAVFCLRLPGEKTAFFNQFAPPEGETPVLAGGCLLLMAGGGLLAVPALTSRDIFGAAAGLLAMLSGAGFLLLAKKLRAGEAVTVAPVLPSLFFSVFFVLTVYLPAGSDPVLARYYIPVLASAMAAYALSQLAGFLKKEGRARAFVFTADLAVPLCLTALADGGGVGRALLFAGCAAVLSVFLILRRDTALPEPDEDKSTPDESAS